MRTRQLLFCSFALMGGLSACQKNTADPSAGQYVRNKAEIQTYVSENKLAGTPDEASGLYYVITPADPTATPRPKLATANEELEFDFKITNLKGQLIDSSTAANPIFYTLGIKAVFSGLEKGLGLMREGDKAILLMPSNLAFDNNAQPNLPAYSAVRFDVRLRRSRSEEQQISEYIVKNKLTVTSIDTTTRLRFIRTSPPTSVSVTPGQTLTVRYRGQTLRARSAFDSVNTTTVVAGQVGMIPGFIRGLALMKVGEKATVIFPSTQGFGKDGLVKGNLYLVTPYAPLRYDLEIVSAR